MTGHPQFLLPLCIQGANTAVPSGHYIPIIALPAPASQACNTGAATGASATATATTGRDCTGGDCTADGQTTTAHVHAHGDEHGADAGGRMVPRAQRLWYSDKCRAGMGSIRGTALAAPCMTHGSACDMNEDGQEQAHHLPPYWQVRHSS